MCVLVNQLIIYQHTHARDGPRAHALTFALAHTRTPFHASKLTLMLIYTVHTHSFMSAHNRTYVHARTYAHASVNTNLVTYAPNPLPYVI